MRNKSLLDALTWHGFLRDDGPDWCEITPVEYACGKKATVITLEDIP
jgi:hypothetical protein